MDTGTVHNRFRLAVSLSNHPDNVRLRVRAGVAEEAAVESGRALRSQSHRQLDFHANPVWTEELATGSHRHRDRLDHDHLDEVGDLEALQMGRSGSGSVFHLGVDSDRLTVEHHVLELGAVIK